MRIPLKILKYILPYKYLLIIASVFALLFSLTNGLTIYSVVPFFNTLSMKNNSQVFALNENEKQLLQKNNPNIYEKARLLPARIKYAINSHFGNRPKKKIILIISISIIPLILVRGLLDLASRMLFSFAGNKAVLNIRKSLFSHVISLRVQSFHRTKSGEIISRLTNDVIPVTNALSNNIYDMVSGIIVLATNIVILSVLNYRMIIFILVLIPLTAAPIAFFGNLVKKYTRKLQEAFAGLSSHLEETFTGIKVIKSFGMYDFENAKFNAINSDIFRKDIRKRIFQNINPSVVELLGALAMTGLIIYGALQITHGKLSGSEFIFFLLIALYMFEPVKSISEALNGIKAGEAAAERIYNVYDLPQEDFMLTGTEAGFRKCIEFRNLSFKYHKEYALKNLSLKINKGTTIGLAGASGAGKSTFLNLLLAFYRPTEGNIFFDNTPINEISLNKIRNKTAYVTQDIFLFHGSVTENIACGRNAKPEEVTDACKTAHAHDFIMKLPDGYDTIIGERGALLSGGERQRLSIARALLCDPEIILFDEATSALDSESEKMIQESLGILFKDRTCVIVSHRLSTIKYADVIYFLKDHSIKDSGTHEELFSRNKGYRALFS